MRPCDLLPRHLVAKTATGPDDPLAADIAAARAGCEVALGRLFTACRFYLLTVANRVLPDQVRAKIGGSDVVQETLVQIHQNFDRFQGTSERELLAWLRGALLNNVQQVTRRYRDTQKRALGREVSLEAGLSGAEQECLIAAVDSPGSQVAATEEAARLSVALARLPESYRRAVVLRNWEDRTFAEIGAEIGRTADAARKLWARAIAQLKIELKDDSSLDGDRGHG